MPALVVPTIFTAVDKITGVIQRMQRSVGGFAGKAAIGVNALNNGLNRLIPGIGGVVRQFRHMFMTAALFGGIVFSFHSILEYEKSLSHLHGLLNTLSEEGFKPYQREVDRVAKAMNYGAGAVADAFTKISERNIALAKTPESLGAVTSAAITLARAAKMELVPATEALVNILFQFDLQGKDSNRVINVLAAGMVRGSSNIENQVEAYKKFAVTAKGANVTLEESNALIQTVAHQVQGSDAGTALRNTILNLEKIPQLYKGGKFDITFALKRVAEHLVSLKTEMKQNIFLQNLFGKRTVNVARQLLTNIPLFERLKTEITGTSEAQALAAKNTDNVTDAWKMLVAQYQNYITSNENTLPGLKRVKDMLRFITKNIDAILDGIVTFVKWWLILKGVVWATQIALAAYNIVLGITGALTGVASIAIGESSVAMAAYRITAMLTTGTNYALGTSIGTIGTGFATAQSTASSFFATLAAFTIPAALVTLAGYGMFEKAKLDRHNAAKKIIDDLPAESAEYQEYYKQWLKAPGAIDPEQFLSDWNLKKTHPDGIMNKLGQRANFGNSLIPKSDMGVAPVYGRVPRPSSDNSDKPTLDITIRDPGQFVQDAKMSDSTKLNINRPGIMPKLSSTTGNK